MKNNNYLELGLFVLLAFIFVSVLFLLQQFLNIDYRIISLSQLAPAFAYVVTVLIFKDMFISLKIKINKTVIARIFFAVIIPLFLCLITFFAGKLYKMDFRVNTDISLLLLMIFGIIIGAIGEEIGWRGFLQPSLDKKFPVLVSSLIVGIIWSVWHIPYFFFGPVYMGLFLIFTISYSIIIVFLLKDIQYNIIVSSVFHASLNLSAQTFLINGMGKNSFQIQAINGVIYSMLAIIIVLCNKEYFLRKPDHNK